MLTTIVASRMPGVLALLMQAGAPAAPPVGPPPPPFEVSVDGAVIPTHELPAAGFGQFELARPVTVAIKAGFDIRWVDVRPLSAGIKPVISADHATVSFTVKRPVGLTIEFNGDWKRVVHLFATPPEAMPPPPDGPTVRRFGPGVHEPGEIRMKDGETVYLAPGAWVKGHINAAGAKNVTIRGRGVLDGSNIPRRPAGQGQGNALPRPPGPPLSEAEREKRMLAQYGGMRRNMVYLEESDGARLEGITLVNSATWTVYVRRSNGVRIAGINILNAAAPCTSDGIDVVSSSDVLIEDVFIRTNDDNIAVKNLDSRESLRDITVRRAVFWNEKCGNAIEIGFELRTGTIENVRFEDIDIIRVERGAAISIHNGDTAMVQNVVFDKIRVEDARHKLIDFAIVWGAYGKDRPQSREERDALTDRGGAWDAILRVKPEERAMRAEFRGHLRNITVRNLHVVSGPLPFSVVAGFDEGHAVTGLAIENLQYLGRRLRNVTDARLSIEHAPGFRIK